MNKTAILNNLSDLEMLKTQPNMVDVETVQNVRTDKPEVVLKFEKYKRGIQIGNSPHYATIEELIRMPSQLLLGKLIELNAYINNQEPGYHNGVCFRVTTRDEIVSFTWQEVKDYLLYAIDKKKSTSFYKRMFREYEVALKHKDADKMGFCAKHLFL
jgi:hypothetical protein